MSGNKLILKLDDAANTAAYNEALLYFESLGFRGKTASDLAIEKVHNNVLFDAGFLPDVDVVVKAWGDGDDASRRENYQKARKAERELADKALQYEMNQSIRSATDKWGKGIGSGLEMISGFTPLWWVAPAVRTGLDLSERNYKGAALNAGLAFAAPYAVGKGIQYISPYAKSAILASKLNKLIRNTKLLQSLLNVTELHPHSRVKVGDVEINDPTMMYRQGHLEIVDDFVDKGFVARSWDPLGDGSVPPQFAEGRLWYGLPKRNNRTGLLVTKQPMRPTDAATRENIPFLTTAGSATYVTDNVGRRIPMYDKLLTTSNTDAFVFKPNYGYLRINKSNPKTSLAFFERLPANITHAEKLGLNKYDRYGLGNFKSDLDWTAHKWMKDNIGGYNILDVMALQSHVPEYLKLELKFKGTTNWLKMRNGKTYIDDPRGWIQLLSKNGRIFDDSPIYTGVKTGVVDPNYNGIFWGTYDNGWISLYLARAYAPNDVSVLELVVPNNVKTYTQTHDVNTSWYALGGKEKPLLTNDVVETHFNNGIDRVNIRGIFDMGPNTGNIHSSKYNKLFDYTTHQGMIDEKFNAKFPQNDVIINLYVPRKSIIGNNGNFNLDDSNIYHKQGGTIHIKKKNKGKFAKVRDYVDYKNSK